MKDQVYTTYDKYIAVSTLVPVGPLFSLSKRQASAMKKISNSVYIVRVKKNIKGCICMKFF